MRIKKLSLFVALLCIVAFVGCNGDKPENKPTPAPQNEDFTFANVAKNNSKISVDILPNDNDMEYVVMFAEQRYFTSNNIDTQEEILADDLNYILGLAEQYGVSVRELLEGLKWLVKGDKIGYQVENLYPDTEYVVYCYGVEFRADTYDVTTDVNYTVITTTAPALINAEFSVESKVEGNVVSLTVTPNDYNGFYYGYIVPESDKYFIAEGEKVTEEHIDHYRNRAYKEFSSYVNDQGIIASQFCYRGTVTIEERLKPNANYQFVLFAVNKDRVPLLCSEPLVYNFSTEDINKSDLVITLDVTDITPYTAQLTVTTSNDTESYACVFLARSQVPAMEDEYELMNFIINNFDPAIFKGGWSEQLLPLMPETEYSVLAFGIENNLPTTSIFRCDFTSATAKEGNIKIESIDILKLFDTYQIAAIDPSYSYLVDQCQCIAVVEMKTSAPTDNAYFWWYEDWMLVEYSEEAFLEDLLMYPPTGTLQLMDMYYDVPSLFAGIAEDEEGNMSPIYYGEVFTLSEEMCDPAEEFFQYIGGRASSVIPFAR